MSNKLLKKLAAGALCISMVIGLAGCGGAVDSDQAEAGAETMDKIRIGLAPDEDSAAVLKKYDPFIQYLSESTGMEVEPFVGADYTAVIEALNSGHLDVAWFGPSEYILATEVVGSGVEAFASAIQAEGTLPYKSSFIVRADSGIESLDDLKGKTLAFTDPASTSGHIFARYSLVQQGYDPEAFFQQIIYSGSHDACLLAVKNKQVDVAAISSRKLPGFVEGGLVEEGEVKIIFESTEIPADPITCRQDLPQDVKDKLKAAFLSDDAALAASLEGTGFAKFGETNDADYDMVRDAYKVAGLEPEL